MNKNDLTRFKNTFNSDNFIDFSYNENSITLIKLSEFYINVPYGVLIFVKHGVQINLLFVEILKTLIFSERLKK